MKKIFPILFMFVSILAIAQSKDYLLSTDGIGSIKLGMPVSELEKILQKKIVLKVIDVDSVILVETINVHYKGINADIDLIKRQDYIAVDRIRTKSPLCKTKSGIGIGSNKLQIINSYEGYNIDIMPVYEDGDNPVKSKNKRSIMVKEGAEGYAILFNLVNDKVVSFEVLPVFDDEE